MANPKHLAILKQGVEVWNRWRADHPDETPELTRADIEDHCLSGIDLFQANLKRAVFRGANLSNANLSWANFIHANASEANLTGADLRQAYLIDTDLHRTDLSRADLRSTHLSEVNLSLAKLDRADFTGAVMSRLLLCEVDLSHTTGLDKIRHGRGSSVDLTTLDLSRSNLPADFLKGVGLPDEFISYWFSTAPKSIEFASTFISFSTKDQPFADRLYADLQSAGVRCWFAPEDIKGGQKIHQQIDEAICMYDRLLLILSEHSMISDWVKTEIANARQWEVREKR